MVYSNWSTPLHGWKNMTTVLRLQTAYDVAKRFGIEKEKSKKLVRFLMKVK